MLRKIFKNWGKNLLCKIEVVDVSGCTVHQIGQHYGNWHTVTVEVKEVFPDTHSIVRIGCRYTKTFRGFSRGDLSLTPSSIPKVGDTFVINLAGWRYI